MIRRLSILSLILLLLAGATHAQPRILVMGDSMMANHQNTGRAVSDVLAAELGAEVVTRAAPAARMLYPLPITGAMGFNIAKQYRRGDWDWVVINGGGNDLVFGCGCRMCDELIGWMIREDGRAGAIPKLAVRLRLSGARVIWLGYLRTPGRGSPIEGCREEGNELEARIARMAALVDGIDFLSMADLVPSGDLSYHAFDRIHPSPKGARAIAMRAVAFIRAEAE